MRRGPAGTNESPAPDLQLDGFAIELHSADFLRAHAWERLAAAAAPVRNGAEQDPYKIHADGADVALCVGVVRKPKEEAGLAHARVSNQEQLEEVIAVGSRVSSRNEPPAFPQWVDGWKAQVPSNAWLPPPPSRTIPDSW